MKRILFLFVLLAGNTLAFAQSSTWNADKTHSAVKFTVTHLMVSDVEGNFKVFNGTLESKGADFNDATTNFTVDIKSVSTDDDKRDAHLKSEDFFNADKFPVMTFKSTSFKKTSGNNYSLTGDLTIKDVTKKVTFTVVNPGVIKDPWGMTRAGFKATTTISRQAFNLKWNKLTEAGGAIVSDEVAIKLNLEFVKK